MNKKILKPVDIEIKEVDDDKREIVMVGSKEVLDRDGDVVKIEGIDLKNFKKNPVILFGHDHRGLPVGKAIKVWKEDKQLMFKIKFPTPEEYSFADTVYKLVKGDYLKASSIGFSPNWDKAERNEKSGGYIFNESELLELSIVPIPANPQALIHSKGIEKALEDDVIDDLELKEFELYIKEYQSKEPVDEVSDDDHVSANLEQNTETEVVEKTPYDWIWESVEEDKQKDDDIIKQIYDLMGLK